MKTFGQISFTLISMVIAVLIGGFVFQTLWGWFIVPTFSMQPLTIIQAIGISFFNHYIETKFNKKECDDKDFMKTVYAALFSKFVTAVITLGIGWVINLFM